MSIEFEEWKEDNDGTFLGKGGCEGCFASDWSVVRLSIENSVMVFLRRALFTPLVLAFDFFGVFSESTSIVNPAETGFSSLNTLIEGGLSEDV
jgi:hypothetical protein